MARRMWAAMAAGLALAASASAAEVLQTSGFSTCDGDDTSMVVQKVDIQYDNTAKLVTFDVAGTSTKSQKVRAVLNVTAYGTQVYSNSFNPCDDATFVQQLCPVPEGTFAAKGTQEIPAQYADMIPAIAFQVPDIAADATLQLFALDTDTNVACLTSEVTNGKTTNIPAVSYVAAAVAGSALIMTGVTAATSVVASGGASMGGVGTASPDFLTIASWFQGMAMNGMSSANLPPVYRKFAQNFGFSAGLIPWKTMQLNIDNFRNVTGGNLTTDSVQYLSNATLVFADNSTATLGSSSSSFKRAMTDLTTVLSRAVTTSVNSTDSSTTSSDISTRINAFGIQAYVEELSIPSANTFMTVLLVVSLVIAAMVVGILLVKAVLEAWALFGNFPDSLAGFRKHYWGSIARAITQLIFLLYGVWVLYCIFQFTHGDSWAALALAAVTLAIFTGVLAFFTYKIWSTARRLQAAEGDASKLYDDKSIWVKYSLFYESYSKDYWWVFVPTIVYMFAKGCCIAAADGHGMIQTIGQLVIELAMLVVLLWSRPYERKSGNWINIIIQVVRVLSVGCILVFVEEFGIAQTTQTVMGVVLIAVQSALTGLLATLLAVNAIIACCRENPHRKRRKELARMRDTDILTPLDARNSLLLDRKHSYSSRDSGDLKLDESYVMTSEIHPMKSPGPYSGAITSVDDNPYHQSLRGEIHSHSRSGSDATYQTIRPTTLIQQLSYGSKEHLTASVAGPGGVDYSDLVGDGPYANKSHLHRSGPYGGSGMYNYDDESRKSQGTYYGYRY